MRARRPRPPLNHPSPEDVGLMETSATYELLEEIGRGDLATVYRARDRVRGRDVAVKQLHEPAHSDPQQQERFWQEAASLVNLQHDHLVRIHGVDQERGWIIMELLQGGLDARVARGPL